MGFSLKNAMNNLLTRTSQIDTQEIRKETLHLGGCLKDTFGDLVSQGVKDAKEVVSNIDKEQLKQQGAVVGKTLKESFNKFVSGTSSLLNEKNNDLVQNADVTDPKTKRDENVEDITKQDMYTLPDNQKVLSDEEKTSTMLKILDWAYDKANSDIPGLGTSQDMAEKYLEKNNGDISAAVNSLIKWQITAAASTGFISNIGGLSTVAVALPANIAGVLAIQLRLISAISHLSGDHRLDEEKRTATYLCLLGAEAGNVLSKTATQFSLKFATSSLKGLSGAALTKINQAVGFRLVTKFGTTGIINLNKLIPVIGGFVGATFDAVSTYTIAQTAKTLFLQEFIDYERQEKIEIERIKILVNMALVDGKYDDSEKEVLLNFVSNISVSDKSKEILLDLVESPRRNNLDLSVFKSDQMLPACLLESLNDLVFADGKFSMAEKIYMKSLMKELGFSKEDFQTYFNN